MTNDTVTACTYLGDSTTPCGHPTLPGKSYCSEHYHIVYQKGTARARRTKDIRVATAVWNIQDTFNEAVQELEAEGYDFAEELWDVRDTDTA
jgi:hypothetical protein